jgi:hypothetical protein
MNLYMLTQEVNTGYDTYDSAIVAAESEDDARNIYPTGGVQVNWRERGSFSVWANEPEQVKVELIGIAADHIKHGVILASFNAG